MKTKFRYDRIMSETFNFPFTTNHRSYWAVSCSHVSPLTKYVPQEVNRPGRVQYLFTYAHNN
jgi:hypothetical protein